MFEVLQNGGSITLIGSGSGHQAAPFMLAYGVSKAGLSHMARCLADEMAAEGVRVKILKHTIAQVMSKTEPAAAA